MAWAFHCFDTVTGAATAILQVESWSHEASLNHTNDRFTCRLAPPQNPAQARNVLAATIDTKCVILPVRDGKTLDGFTGWVPPGGRRRPDLTGGSLLNVFDWRHLGFDTVTYTQVDQFTIAANLIQIGQADAVVASPPGGFGLGNFPAGPGIGVDQVGTSGVLRDQTWNVWEAKNVGEALRQRAALLNGYDFAIHTELDPGPEGLQVPARRLRCFYPRRGSGFIAGQSPVFTVGGNVITVPEIAGNEEFADAILALGDELDEMTRERLTRYRTSVAYASFVAGYPLIERVLDLPDVSVSSTLDGHADGYLQRGSIVADDEIVLDVNPNDTTYPYGNWQLGDDCQVVIPAGIDPWWPDGLNETRRVLAHRWTYDATGERLQVVTGLPWVAT